MLKKSLNLNNQNSKISKEEAFELLLRSERISGVGHWKYDLPSDTLFWSDEIYKIHGVTKDTYTPDISSGIKFYHPDDLETVSKAVENTLQFGEIFNYRHRIIRPDGEIRHVDAYGEPTQDKFGKVISMFGVFRDVTELVLRQQELKHSKDFLKSIIDASPDMIFVKDDQFRIQMANKAFLSMYSEEQRDKVIGTTTLENFPKEEAEKFLEQDRYALEKGYTDKVEDVSNSGSDFTRTVFTKKVGFTDIHGNQFLLGMARDITDLVQAQKNLEKSERRLNQALTASLAGLYDWNLESKSLYWSDRFLEILGIDNFQATEDEFYTRLHPEESDAVKKELDTYIRSGETYNSVHRLRHNKGHYIWLHFRGQCTRDKDSNNRRLLGTAVDITDQKNLELKNAMYLRDLELSNAELEEFAIITSHDLKEPTRAINFMAQMLEEDLGDNITDFQQDKLGKILKLTKQMQNLLKALMENSKIGKIKDNISHVNLDDVLNNVLINFDTLIINNNVTVTRSSQLGSDICDKIKVSEVLQNLISNAVKYNDNEFKNIEIGRVSSPQNSSSQSIYYVKDNGIGIPQQYRDRVFKIFKRLHHKNEYGGGSGAGLSICKKIIQNHGGDIWIETNEWGGSTFFFTLEP